MMKVVVSGYECWVRGKDVVVADFVENAVFTFRGVIVYIKDGCYRVARLGDVEELDISVFNEV